MPETFGRAEVVETAVDSTVGALALEAVTRHWNLSAKTKWSPLSLDVCALSKAGQTLVGVGNVLGQDLGSSELNDIHSLVWRNDRSLGSQQDEGLKHDQR